MPPTVAHRLTTVLLILSIIVGAFTMGAAVTSDPVVTFDASAQPDRKLLPRGILPAGDERMAFAIDDPTGREQRLALAADLLPLALWIALLWLLHGIARSVRRGDPFVRDNVRRLRAIGVVLIVGVVAAHYLGVALQDALAEPYSRSALEPVTTPGLLPADTDFPGLPLLCGLGAFVVAQVFAHGVALRDDVAATI